MGYEEEIVADAPVGGSALGWFEFRPAGLANF
jgi:hypothetical protein